MKTLLVVVTLAAGLLIAGAAPTVAGLDIVIEGLDCESQPEVVRVFNRGEATFDLTGWSLASDPVSSETFDLSEFGMLRGGNTLRVSSGKGASGAFAWSTREVFRDGDPTDFVRLLNPSGQTTFEVACELRGGTPTVVPSPTAKPEPTSALPTATGGTVVAAATTTPSAADMPFGGGPPGGTSSLTPVLLAGTVVSFTGLLLLVTALAGVGAVAVKARPEWAEVVTTVTAATVTGPRPKRSLWMAALLVVVALSGVAFVATRGKRLR